MRRGFAARGRGFAAGNRRSCASRGRLLRRLEAPALPARGRGFAAKNSVSEQMRLRRYQDSGMELPSKDTAPPLHTHPSSLNPRARSAPFTLIPYHSSLGREAPPPHSYLHTLPFLFEFVKFSFESTDSIKFAIIFPFLNFFLFRKLLFWTFLQSIFY